MKSLFDTEAYEEILNRFNSLNKNSQPKWGKMNVAQMLKHCQLPLDVANESMTLNTNVGFIKKLIFKLFKPIMYNDKAWSHNSPTAKEFIVVDAQEFNTEKDKLLTIIKAFHSKKDKTNWPKHPIFGNFTPEQWGKMQYKHLDHHLTQFEE
jgi:Protein of unknown function (DUF1569)